MGNLLLPSTEYVIAAPSTGDDAVTIVCRGAVATIEATTVGVDMGDVAAVEGAITRTAGRLLAGCLTCTCLTVVGVMRAAVI